MWADEHHHDPADEHHDQPEQHDHLDPIGDNLMALDLDHNGTLVHVDDNDPHDDLDNTPAYRDALHITNNQPTHHQFEHLIRDAFLWERIETAAETAVERERRRMRDLTLWQRLRWAVNPASDRGL